MALEMDFDSPESARENRLLLQFKDGREVVRCVVTAEVVQDLGSHYKLQFSADDVAEVLIPELDRIATTKYRAGRIEENGELLIRTSDLLRYGF
jgi:hypothetical protein